LAADALEAACIRSTSLRFAFKEMDKFYALNSQETSTVAAFVSAESAVSCRQALPVRRLTRNKLVKIFTNLNFGR
jgi:hypothetical protein